MSTPKYTDEELIAAVKKANSYNDVLHIIGAGKSATTWLHFKRRIEQMNLDVSHFGSTSKKLSTAKKSAAEILVLNPTHSKRVPAFQLRRALIEKGGNVLLFRVFDFRFLQRKADTSTHRPHKWRFY